MAKVYATTPGAEVWISPYGAATNERPCVVPEAVGRELATVEGLRVEPDEPAPAPAAKKRTAAAPAEAMSEKE